jgi:nucleoside 2-deoxyribosyltransferase
MKIYLAGRFHTSQAINLFADQLQREGHEVVSTWHRTEALNRPLPEPKKGAIDGPSAMIAVRELVEIETADALIVMSADCEWTPGGLWFEMGYASGLKKKVYVYGPRQNIFCHLVEDWEQEKRPA